MTTGPEAHHKPLVPPQRFQWAPLLVAVVTFVAGGVTGAGLYSLLGPKPTSATSQIRGTTAQERATEWVDRIDEQVALTAPQKEKVDRFALRFVNEYLEIRLIIQPEIERVMSEFNKQMLAVLDEPQKPKWDKYFQELMARIRTKPSTQPIAPSRN